MKCPTCDNNLHTYMRQFTSPKKWHCGSCDCSWEVDTDGDISDRLANIEARLSLLEQADKIREDRERMAGEYGD